MTDKSLREMSDTQFLAWLRTVDRKGTVWVVPAGSGRYAIPDEERVRVLNALETKGAYLPGIMGAPPVAPMETARHSSQERLQQLIEEALARLEEAHELARQEQSRGLNRSVAQMLEGGMQVVARARDSFLS